MPDGIHLPTWRRLAIAHLQDVVQLVALNVPDKYETRSAEIIEKAQQLKQQIIMLGGS